VNDFDFGLWAKARGFERSELTHLQLTSLQKLWREFLLSPVMEGEILDLLGELDKHKLIEKNAEGKWSLTACGKAAVEEMNRTPIDPTEGTDGFE
jgi:hypothetical protein